MTSRSSFSAEISVVRASFDVGARAQHVDFVLQPLVLFSRPLLVGRHPIDHPDEALDLVLEAIEGFELHVARCRLRHMRSPASLSQHRAVLAHERSQNHLDALLHFGVGQRAIGCLERQPQRQADSAVRHALALYRSKTRTLTIGAGAAAPAARMVPRMISAGKASSTTIDRSRTTNGCRGSGCAASPRSDRARPRGIEVDLGHEDRVLARRAASVGDGRRELSDHAERRDRRR